MIHTLYITNPINLKQFNDLYNIIKPYADDKNTDTYQKHISYNFKSDGLIIFLTKYNKQFPTVILKYAIEIRLNPKRLIEKDNHILLMQEQDILSVDKEFNKIIKNIYSDLPEFDRWKTGRIDYAVQIKTKHVKLYIELFQRADKPNRHYHEQDLEENNKRGQKTGSYYQISKSVRINIYDKEAQQINEGADRQTIEQAKDILRFEVQINKEKIKQMVRTDKDILNSELSNFLPKELAQETLTKYFDQTIREGDFYSLNEIRKIMKKRQDIKPKMKEKLIEFIKLINQKENIWTAKDLYNNDRLFNSYVKQLREDLNINPITIPRERKVPHLTNPKKELIDTLT